MLQKMPDIAAYMPMADTFRRHTRHAVTRDTP